MINVFLAPRSNEYAVRHFQNTIENGVNFADIEEELSDAGKFILNGREKLYIWGCTDSLRGKRSAMKQGDYVMFYVKGTFKYVGRVIYTEYNDLLGSILWPIQEDGKSRPCLFFLDDIKEIHMPLEDINDLCGYNFKALLGFQSLNDKAIKNIIERYGTLESFLGYDGNNQGLIKESEDFVNGEMEKYKKLSIEERLNKITEEAATKPQKQRQIIYATIARNPILAGLIKERVNYICELCGQEPFATKSGGWYAEAHHMKELSRGGKDTYDNMICVCPTCHKKLHYGTQGIYDGLIEKLINK